MLFTEDSTVLKEVNNIFFKIHQKPINYTRTYYYWKKFQNVSSLFKDALKSKEGPVKVIDVGCGLGAYIFYLNQDFGKANAIEFHGIDLDQSSLHCCELRKRAYQTTNASFAIGNAEQLDVSDSSFDILLSVEVLEHLKEPQRAVSEFYRVLKPGGIAIVTTPNLSNVALRLKSALCKTAPSISDSSEGSSPDALDDNGKTYGHISVKTLKQWKEIFQRCKFKIQKIGRGSLFNGTPRQDRRRVVFALAILLETVLDKVPFFNNFSEDVIIKARKEWSPTA